MFGLRVCRFVSHHHFLHTVRYLVKQGPHHCMSCWMLKKNARSIRANLKCQSSEQSPSLHGVQVVDDWERLTAHIEADKESKEQLGWVREMYAFSIAAALQVRPVHPGRCAWSQQARSMVDSGVV